jgi:hypothetical protein
MSKRKVESKYVQGWYLFDKQLAFNFFSRKGIEC